MKLTPKKLNSFMLFKLPSAFICGVRAKTLNNECCVVTVKHKWINQNPFKSMFWAVQGMAAELTTGAIIISKIRQSNRRFSMLVTANNATFIKKGTGKITFTCNDGQLVDRVLAKAIKTKQGQIIKMESVGKNEEGIIVSAFNFEWSVKLKEV